MFPKMLKDTTSTFMMKGVGAIGVDAKVIHINFQPEFSNHISKDMIHESLESGWSIAKVEEYNCRFKQAKRGDKGCFSLVQFLDANIVVSPSNVKFGEVV